MRLAIDVMGGDHAPDAILKGCIDALPDLLPDDVLVLVGDRREIEDILSERGVSDKRLVIEHAGDVIDMNDSPVEAVRVKTDSSIVKMALLGSSKAETPCDVVLSAGNTGACVTAATMHMKRLPGVHRPGIVVTMPTFAGPVVLCDAGANPLPRASHLWQYGMMASVYATKAFGIERPRVATMNIGVEEGKGTSLVKATHELLKATPTVNYVGYIEGRDFFDGVADVVVADGFTGNTMLKTAEGLAKSMFNGVAQAVFDANPDLAMQLAPIMQGIYSSRDYHELGGAPLLGVNGACVIAHGSSEARTIRSSIRQCRKIVQTHVNSAIVAALAETAHIGELQREPA